MTRISISLLLKVFQQFSQHMIIRASKAFSLNDFIVLPLQYDFDRATSIQTINIQQGLGTHIATHPFYFATPHFSVYLRLLHKLIISQPFQIGNLHTYTCASSQHFHKTNFITVIVDVAFKNHCASIGGLILIHGKIIICWEKILSGAPKSTYAEVTPF